jgi:hypothetical protein
MCKPVVRDKKRKGGCHFHDTFTDWNEFTVEFALMFCPENKSMTALM